MKTVNILNVEKVTKGYGDRILLNNVTLGINQGDKIGVIGVNGTGKSTILKIIAGLETPDEGQVTKGSNVTVAYLPQNPEFEKGESIIAYVMKGKKDKNENYNIENEAKKILTQLGVIDFDADISKLSGGQRKRIALARTLVAPADILVLDEPTNHLDNEMVIWLEQYVKKLRGQLVMVTHDRYFLDNVTNKIVEIDKANLFSYDTNYSGFLQLKSEREDMESASERKRQTVLRTELAWMSRGPQGRATKQNARIDRYEDLKESSKEARNSFEKQSLDISSITTRLGKKTLELNNICKKYGDKKLINDFSYIFLRDDRIGIIGSNGCGKSTLLKIMTGLIEPDSGTVEIGDTVKLGFFMQENEILDENINVLEHVKNIGEFVNTASGQISASQMCERFLFTPKMQWTPISNLSGGEKRRLYLLNVLMEAPNVIILDEPTNDLDIETLEILEEYLDNFAGIVITVSHDRYFLDRIVDRIFAFDGMGKIEQYEGGFSDYYEKRQLLLSETNGSNTANTKEKNLDGSKEKYSKDRPQKLKFSYMEQKEYETIDEDIEKIEQSIEKIDSDIAKSATQYSKLNELMAEKSLKEKELEEKMEHWMFLNDLAEKIEAQ